tara:strand:+ start:11939 stop:14194 length:2256 start_codon:yes stop_codon:yes gene_type:complete
MAKKTNKKKKKPSVVNGLDVSRKPKRVLTSRTRNLTTEDLSTPRQWGPEAEPTVPRGEPRPRTLNYTAEDLAREAAIGPENPPRQWGPEAKPTVPRGEPRSPEQIAEWERNTTPATLQEERKFFEEFDSGQAVQGAPPDPSAMPGFNYADFDDAKARDSGPDGGVRMPPAPPTVEQQVADKYFDGDLEALDNAIAYRSERTTDNPVSQGAIQAEAKKEADRSQSIINEGREARRLEEKAKVDPTMRIMGGGDYSRFSNVVEEHVARNASQYDMNVPRKDREIWALRQRENRERLTKVEEGSRVESSEGLTLFEMWKQTGGWINPSTGEQIPYTSIPRDVIKAAQKYTNEFGPPEKRDYKPAARYTTTENGAVYVEGRRSNDYQPGLITGINAYLGTPGSEEATNNMGRGAPMYRESPEETDAQIQRRADSSDRRDVSRRSATIRAISRRPGGIRKSHLERANENLPPHLRISPEEVGLPGRRSPNQIRSVDDLGELSVQTADVGEFLESPTGLIRVGEYHSVIPMFRADNGKVVPNADVMSFDDFSRSLTGSDRRTVREMIMAGGNNEFSKAQRSISKSKGILMNSEDYTEAERANAAADLKIKESELHYKFLQEHGPSESNPQPMDRLPPLSNKEISEQIQMETRREALIAAQQKRIDGDTDSPAFSVDTPGTPSPAAATGNANTGVDATTDEFLRALAGVHQEQINNSGERISPVRVDVDLREYMAERGMPDSSLYLLRRRYSLIMSGG